MSICHLTSNRVWFMNLVYGMIRGHMRKVTGCSGNWAQELNQDERNEDRARPTAQRESENHQWHNKPAYMILFSNILYIDGACW